MTGLPMKMQIGSQEFILLASFGFVFVLVLILRRHGHGGGGRRLLWRRLLRRLSRRRVLRRRRIFRRRRRLLGRRRRFLRRRQLARVLTEYRISKQKRTSVFPKSVSFCCISSGAYRSASGTYGFTPETLLYAGRMILSTFVNSSSICALQPTMRAMAKIGV